VIPISGLLRTVLESHRAVIKNNSPDDLVFCIPSRTPLNVTESSNHVSRGIRSGIPCDAAHGSGRVDQDCTGPIGPFGSWDDPQYLCHVIPDSQRRAVQKVAGVLFSDVLKLGQEVESGKIN
jgi:hypothetical protein